MVIATQADLQCRCPRRPFEPDLDVDVAFVDREQIVQDQITLRLIEAHDSFGERSIHPQSFPASRRMDTNQTMLTLDMLWTLLWMVSVEVRVS